MLLPVPSWSFCFGLPAEFQERREDTLYRSENLPRWEVGRRREGESCQCVCVGGDTPSVMRFQTEYEQLGRGVCIRETARIQLDEWKREKQQLPSLNAMCEQRLNTCSGN